jgi:hypothetical protein
MDRLEATAAVSQQIPAPLAELKDANTFDEPRAGYCALSRDMRRESQVKSLPPRI